MPFNRWLPTIRGKLYCLVLTMLVPVLLLQAGYLYERFQGRQASEFQVNLEMARAVAGTFNAFVQDVLHQELAICINLTMPQDFTIEQMNRILEANRSALPSIRNFAWVTPQGRIIASDLARVIGQDIAARPFIRDIVEGSEWSVSDLSLSIGTGEPVFFISRGIRDGEGKLLGIVVGVVRAERLKAILGLDLSRSGSITILDSMAMLVDSYPQREFKWEERNYSQKRPGISQAFEGKEVTGTFPSFSNLSDGEERIVTCTPSGFTKWVVCVSRSKREVMAPIRSQAIQQSALSLLLTAVIFVAAFFLSHGIVGPIGKLRDYAMALGRGEPMQSVEFKGSVELLDLASSFNAMADEIGIREKALRRSEEKYRELVENANCIITRLSLDGSITFFNEFAQEFFGYTEEEILGRHVIGTIVPERDLAADDLRTMFEGVLRNPEQHASHENENMLKNGDRVWIMWANKALFDEQGNVCGILGIGTDITARKNAEDALRKSEQEKTAILGSLRHVAVEYLDPELRVIWTNSTTEQVFSLTPEELKGKKCFEAIHGLSEPCRGCTAIKAVQTGEPQEGEIIKADGRAWLVSSNPVKDSSGKVTNVVHAAMNITRRKQREEALRAEIAEREQVEAIRRLDEARLEALWQLSQMTESSTYQTAKFSLEQLVRLTESEVGWIGFLDECETSLTFHGWPEIDVQDSTMANEPLHVPVERADIFRDAIREKRVVVIDGYSGSNKEMNGYLERHGPLARIMIIPIFENDRIVAIAGVGNKAEEYNPSDARHITLLMDGMWKIIQRDRAEKTLRESESLAAMGRAMAAVAHDMKTPLIAIGGFARLALRHIETGSPIQDKLEIVVNETRRMENMVKSILDFSRPLELEWANGDIASLVAECLMIVSPLAQEKKVQVCSRLDPCVIPGVKLDFMRMKQVLINLMTNAIQASQEDDEVTIQCYINGRNLFIKVIDCGCGISAEKRHEIFSPFYTTKKEGTGLGLPIVKKIVEAHHGRIEIFDNPDKGMTFQVKIPIDLSSDEVSYRVAS
ncbi:MAG: PAS domain S-box protein [Syntrophobacteraceae bacterium]